MNTATPDKKRPRNACSRRPALSSRDAKKTFTTAKTGVLHDHVA
jgi:hypothetical protein